MDLINFSDGLQCTTSSFLRKDTQLEHAINVHFDNIGSVTKRLGYTAQGTSAGSQIRGLCSYPNTSGGTTRLFRAFNGNIEYYNGSAWVAVTTYTPVDAEVKMKVFLDQLFVVGRGTAFMTPINIDGTSPSTSRNLSNAPKAKLIELFMDQLWFADVEVSGTRYGSRMYCCSIPNTAGTTVTWTSTDYETVYTNNGDTIQALHANKALQQMLIWKDNSMHAWNGYKILDLGNIGTNSDKSVQTLNFTTFFFSPEKGVYAYSGQQPQLISRPINKWLKGISDMGAVCSSQEDGRIYKLYIGTTVVDGVTYDRCEAVYSVMDNNWTIYQYADDFSVFCEHKNSSGLLRWYGGTTAGLVHEFATGNDAVYSDNGSDISAEFLTKAYDLKTASQKVFINKAILYSTQPQGLSGRMRYRGKDWVTYFSVDNTEEVVNVNPKEGRFVQFHLSETSQNPPFQFEGLSFDPTVVSEYTK